MPAKDRKRYSVHRAIRMQAEIMDGKRSRYDGLEAEVHEELSKHRTGADHGGVLVPWRLRDEDAGQERVLGTTQPTGGATLVGQQVMPDMIDLLRNRALVLVAGARLYPGLQGVVYFNKKTGAPSVTWMEENPPADAPQSEPAYGYALAEDAYRPGADPAAALVMSSIDVESDAHDLAIGHGPVFIRRAARQGHRQAAGRDLLRRRRALTRGGRGPRPRGHHDHAGPGRRQERRPREPLLDDHAAHGGCAQANAARLRLPGLPLERHVP
jgi:hypothetical protein